MKEFSEEIYREYNKTLLLNLFRKICAKMDNDKSFDLKIRRLFQQSYDKIKTTKAIIKDNFNYDLTEADAISLNDWFNARLKKCNTRKSISRETKLKLINQQGGVCAACGEPLSTDLSKVHVDHIIPWKLVGDELPNNYQALCETCNECKSASIDYMFRNMINLN